MPEALNPCPRCGSNEVYVYITCKTGDPWNDYYMIKCEACNLKGPVGWTPEAARKLWNDKAKEASNGKA